MVFNTTFNNFSGISWRSILWVEESGGPAENRDLSQVTDKLYHIMLNTSPWSRYELTTSVVIGTDCIASCKSNYHTITIMTAPFCKWMFSLWAYPYTTAACDTVFYGIICGDFVRCCSIVWWHDMVLRTGVKIQISIIIIQPKSKF